MKRKTKILIVDDHDIILDGIKSILSKLEDVEIVASASNALEGLKLLEATKAELVITDLNMPEMDGLTFIKTIRDQFPPTKIIVLSLHDEAHFIQNVMKQRVQAYILKNETSNDLLLAVQRVLDGKTFFSDKINRVLMEQMNQPTAQKLLSERELQIVRLISKELNNREIAGQLFISERTVETHRKNIFRKTGTSSIVGLIKYAFANNLIQ